MNQKMTLDKKISETSTQEIPEHRNFKEGDFFYTEKDGKFQIFKLLKIVNSYDISGVFHVKKFEEATSIPNPNEVETLKVEMHHLPMEKEAFINPKFIHNAAVSEEELLGYYEWLKGFKSKPVDPQKVSLTETIILCAYEFFKKEMS